jgi:hypothetical protein
MSYQPKGVFMFNKLDWLFNLGLTACAVYVAVVIGNVLFHFASLLIK